jgi:hypothetical protein
MVSKETAWECGSCERIEYGEFPPQECQECWKTNSFIEVPEDMREQIGDRVLEDIKRKSFDEDEEEEE